MIRLGMARTGKTLRLVAPLAGPPERLVDLSAVEAVRLAKLGEGRPEALAEALVPPDLRDLLGGGARALARARQALAYAEKWERRGGLPAELQVPATALEGWEPPSLRTLEGRRLDASAVLSPRQALPGRPQASLCLVGTGTPGTVAFRLALVGEGRLRLSPWLALEGTAALQLSVAGHRRKVGAEVWEGVDLPALAPGEHLLLPPPKLRPWPSLPKGAPIDLRWGEDRLQASLARGLEHPTLQ